MDAFTAGKQLPTLLELTKTLLVPDGQKNADQETKDKVPSDLDQVVHDNLEDLLPDHPDNHEGQ